MEQLLIIDPPNELRFIGPFTKSVVTVMTIKNPTEHMILFKIKTTAPKRYCVRPNFGHCAPGEVISVDICLQPFIYDPNEKNKHKFMVQSLVAPNDLASSDLDYAQVWRDAEPDKLMDAKLKCVFEMPGALIQTKSGSASSATNEAIKEASPKSEEKSLDKLQISNLPPADKSSDAIVAELRQLREENSDLRKENIYFRDQVMRFKNSAAKPMADEPYAPMAEKQIPIFYIAIAILATFIGLLLGKYLL